MLCSLTAIHPHITTRFAAHHLASWVRRSVRHSPLLTSLCLSSQSPGMSEPHVPLDALVDSLASSPHRARVLRVLDLDGALVSAWAFAKLCSACEELIVLNVGVGMRSLVCMIPFFWVFFPFLCYSLFQSAFMNGLETLPKLHTVIVSIKNATRTRRRNAFGFEDAERVLSRSSNRCLRRIVVDGAMWQVSPFSFHDSPE
jgi:hypothetical protein